MYVGHARSLQIFSHTTIRKQEKPAIVTETNAIAESEKGDETIRAVQLPLRLCSFPVTRTPPLPLLA
jgi:hypothetical protein